RDGLLKAQEGTMTHSDRCTAETEHEPPWPPSPSPDPSGGPIHIAPPPSDARMPPTVPVTHWPESLCRSTAAGAWTSKTFKRYCATARPRVHSPEQPSTGPAEAHMDLPATLGEAAT